LQLVSVRAILAFRVLAGLRESSRHRFHSNLVAAESMQQRAESKSPPIIVILDGKVARGGS
jgi:hypothetical protein